jgi:hypothetical protein
MKKNNLAYIRDLEAIVACQQSDGYLKNWAIEKLDRVLHKIRSKSVDSSEKQLSQCTV